MAGGAGVDLQKHTWKDVFPTLPLAPSGRAQLRCPQCSDGTAQVQGTPETQPWAFVIAPHLGRCAGGSQDSIQGQTDIQPLYEVRGKFMDLPFSHSPSTPGPWCILTPQ